VTFHAALLRARGARRLLPLAAVLAAAAAGCDASDTRAEPDGGAVPDAGPDAGDDASLEDAGMLAPCPDPSLEPGTSTLTLEHEGEMREYRVYVPAGVDLGRPAPLVLNWHGLTSEASAQQVYSQADEVAAERGYLVAYPQGLGRSFNGGSCCSNLGQPAHQADDVGFGRAIVDALAERICIDRRRVYSTGMSNGGYMSEWNACQAADLYAAVAPVSAMGLMQQGCAPSRPIPLLAFNGTNDSLVSYAGSQASITQWLARNGCEGEPQRTNYGPSYCDAWTECTAGVEVVHCTITEMGHCWPGNPIALPGFCMDGGLDHMHATPMLFDFFDRFRLP
jgi:polyhydroxybutyrate depolymerase